MYGDIGTSPLYTIKEAFVAEQAAQCGYCLSGPILYGYAFVRDNPGASRADIEKGVSGDLICRCCTNSRMVDAIVRYAQEGVHAETSRAARGLRAEEGRQ